MNTQTQKLILKLAAAFVLVSATFVTMAMDINKMQAQQELAMHSQEKVQTMIENMEKIQAVNQIMEHTHAMTKSMEETQNRVNAQLDIDVNNTETEPKTEAPIETDSSLTN